MKVLTIVGARPQFIKAAVVSDVLRKTHHEVLVHTGQHFDYNMSEQFFEELGIPKPDYNLGISGGSHAEMTGKMMIAIEKVLIEEAPDCMLVYGDTNSTLAGALAAVKLHIPICHVEAGVRAHNPASPEEINRICTDHVSTLLLASTQSGVDNMKTEGLSDRTWFVGDPMYDAFLKYSRKVKKEEIGLSILWGGIQREVPEQYYYLTCHREENTNDDKTLYEILNTMEQLEIPTVYPVHPRNKERALRLQRKCKFKNIIFTEPVGYLENISLVRNAKKVVTDSGGVQREAFFAGKKCVTVLDSVFWPETMVENRNELSTPESDDILEKLAHKQNVDEQYQPFGDGHSAERIVREMEKMVLFP